MASFCIWYFLAPDGGSGEFSVIAEEASTLEDCWTGSLQREFPADSYSFQAGSNGKNRQPERHFACTIRTIIQLYRGGISVYQCGKAERRKGLAEQVREILRQGHPTITRHVLL